MLEREKLLQSLSLPDEIGRKPMSEETISWLQTVEDDISEEDWKRFGALMGLELRIVHEQNEGAYLSEFDKVVEEARHTGEIYRQLARLGEARGFDEDVTEAYVDLSEWALGWSLVETPVKYSTRSRKFLERYRRYSPLLDVSAEE